MAPELLLSKPYNTAVDVFAFGVLLNECFRREVPWDGYKPLDIKQMVVDGQRPPTALTMPTALERMLGRLWHQQADARPAFYRIVDDLRAVCDTLPAGGGGDSLGRSLRDMPDALDALMR